MSLAADGTQSEPATLIVFVGAGIEEGFLPAGGR